MKKKHLTLAVLILVHTSLAFPQYMPTQEDISLISHKNDLRIGVAINMTDNMALSSTSTVTYGLTDDLAIQCYGITSRLFDIETGNYFHGASGALGKYKQLTNKSVIELFVGTGFGGSHFFYEIVEEKEVDIEAVYMQYFLKFNYGKIGTGKCHFERGLSLKCEFSDFRVADHYVSLRSKYYKKRHIALEPSLYSALGGEKFKVGAMLSSVIPLEIASDSGDFEYDYIHFAINFSYRLSVK